MPEQRFLRFVANPTSLVRWGILVDPDTVAELSEAPWRSLSRTGATYSRSSIRLLAPAEPTKILALAYNYRDLFSDPAARTSAREAHYTDPGFEPLVFLKGPNCVTHPGDPITIPSDVPEVWVEVEVTAIIGRRVRDLRDAAAARDVVFGVTIGNDVTALNVLGRDWHLARSKSLDGFCPLGPELVSGFDDSRRALSTKIAGRMTQSSSTKNRVLDTYEAVAMVSRLMTLEPGDAVLTGTPAGARQSLVRVGDTVELEIEGLGVLHNTIVGAKG